MPQVWEGGRKRRVDQEKFIKDGSTPHHPQKDGSMKDGFLNGADLLELGPDFAFILSYTNYIQMSFECLAF